MAVTATVYVPALEHLTDADFDWLADDIRVALVASGYTPNTDTHAYFSDVTNEVTGTGYTAGGAALGTKTRTLDTATNKVTLDAADTSWPGAVVTPRYAVVYKKRGGAASADELLLLVDFGADVPASGGFEILWNASGILTATAT